MFSQPSDFEKGFDIDNTIWKAFEKFAVDDGVSINNISASDKKFLIQRLKSLFARQQWRNEGFYEVNNANDPIIKRALEEMSGK